MVVRDTREQTNQIEVYRNEQFIQAQKFRLL